MTVTVSGLVDDRGMHAVGQGRPRDGVDGRRGVSGRGRRRRAAVAWLLAVTAAVWLLAAGSARALTSSATSVSNAVKSGGVDLGRVTLATTYKSGQVTARVSSSGIRLVGGHQYNASVCLNTHVLGVAPDGHCISRNIDTRSANRVKTYAVDTVTKTVSRPAAGNSGYATQQLTVTRLDGWTWTPIADSWPAGNIADASLPLFADGAASGPLPEQQGVLLESTSAHGGANSGLPDSMCTSRPTGDATARSDLSIDALGALPFHYEVGAPSGDYAAQSPKGVMIVLHGGGWVSNGGAAVQGLRGEADRWRERGWLTVNSSYRACGLAAGDALLLYDRVRATYGAAVPVCALGQSAGGHLALIVAARRAGGVKCVIDQGGPTDPATLLTQGAYDAATGGSQTNWPKWVYNLMVAAFGQENLTAVSPAQLVDSGLSGTRILAASAARDELVPPAQMTLLRHRMLAADGDAYVDVRQLEAGDQPFVHASVSRAALDDYHEAEKALVSGFAP